MEGALDLLDDHELGQVALPAHVEAGREPPADGRGERLDVAVRREFVRGARQDQLVGIEGVGLITKFKLELLLEVLERERVELVLDAGLPNRRTRSSVDR